MLPILSLTDPLVLASAIPAFFAGILLYCAIEQAWQASSTGEDDILGLAPVFARLRGIDYGALSYEYDLRVRSAVGAYLDALELAGALEPSEYVVEDGELKATAWRPSSLYDQEQEERRSGWPQRIETGLHGRRVTSKCADCRMPATEGSAFCDAHRYARATWGEEVSR